MTIKDKHNHTNLDINEVVNRLKGIRAETQSHRTFAERDVEETIKWFKENFPNRVADRPKYEEHSRKTLWIRQNGRCAICGEDLATVPNHVDHIITLDNGGWTELSNLQLTCADCNRDKGAYNKPDDVLDYILSTLHREGWGRP